jgi:serine protease Do
MSSPLPGRVAEALRQSTVSLPGGSGAIIGPERVITNAHVITSRTVEIDSWEGKRVRGSLSKIDKIHDLALLEAPGLNGVPVSLGDSNLLRSGAPVFAVGNPLGFIGALSSGTVLKVGTIRFPRGFAHHGEWICSKLRLAPGNSGGPLADYQGQMVGLNTMIAPGGLAFAVPSRTIQNFLLTAATPRTLGVTIRPVQMPDGRNGLLILELTPGGAAEAASLLQGDLLIRANARRLQGADDLLFAIEEAANGLLQLAFYRGRFNALRTVTAQLKSFPFSNAA